MSDLEKRLANTEKALVALWSLIQDTLPPAYQEDTDKMMEEYFNANCKLGADFNNASGKYFQE